MIHHRTGVVNVDDVLLLYGSVVSTTIAIDDRTALDFKIGLVQLGKYEWCCTPGNDNVSLLNDIFTTFH